MKPELLTLGFDTSAAHCAAALLSGTEVLTAISEDMTRGQAERLMPMIEEMLTAHGLGWSDLHRIGVGIGLTITHNGIISITAASASPPAHHRHHRHHV